MLRVVKITTNDFGAYNAGEPSQKNEGIIWEGDDHIALSQQYPPSDVMFADPLDHSEIEDGLIRFDYRFEELIDGTWQQCKDPRVRLQTGMTAAEREQDAENRRLFPGDYYDGCPCGISDCHGDYCGAADEDEHTGWEEEYRPSETLT